MTGDGVDQARVGDVDRVAVTTSALVQDGRVIADSEEIISPESNAVMMTFALARLHLDRGMDPPFPPPADADLAQAEREEAHWRMTVLDHLRALPHDAMLTVVDVHS
jgi:hypothetical protein